MKSFASVKSFVLLESILVILLIMSWTLFDSSMLQITAPLIIVCAVISSVLWLAVRHYRSNAFLKRRLETSIRNQEQILRSMSKQAHLKKLSVQAKKLDDIIFLLDTNTDEIRRVFADIDSEKPDKLEIHAFDDIAVIRDQIDAIQNDLSALKSVSLPTADN